MTRHRSLSRADNVLVVQHPSGTVAVRTLLPGDAIIDLDRAEGKVVRARRTAWFLGKRARVSIGTYTDPKATQFSPAWEEVVAYALPSYSHPRVLIAPRACVSQRGSPRSSQTTERDSRESGLAEGRNGCAVWLPDPD